MNDTGGDSESSLGTGGETGDTGDIGTAGVSDTAPSDTGGASTPDAGGSAADLTAPAAPDTGTAPGGGHTVETVGAADAKGPGASAPADRGSLSRDSAEAAETGKPETVTWLNGTVLLKSDYNAGDKVTEDSLKTIDHNAKIVAVDHAKRAAPDRTGELDAILAAPSKAQIGNTGPRVAGSRSMETGEITINKDLTNAMAEHTARHEHTHEASFQKSETVETDTQKVDVMISGIHSMVTLTDKTEGGKIETLDHHRALNEGITERETLAAEKEVYGFEKGKEFHCYSTNVDYTAQLADLVGNETIQDAYYNGNLAHLSAAVNDLAKDEEAFTTLSARLDEACKGYDMNNLTPEQQEAARQSIENARTELDTLLARMAQTKAEIEDAKNNGK